MNKSSALSKYLTSQGSIHLYLPNGSLYHVRKEISSNIDNNSEKEVELTDVVRAGDGSLVDLIRDPDDPAALCLLRWADGKVTRGPRMRVDGKVLIPPKLESQVISNLRLATEMQPIVHLEDLLTRILGILVEAVGLPDQMPQLVSKFALATWFTDHLPVAPYLWIIGPPASGKTTLLRILHALCRRALLLGDISPASLYRLCNGLRPTLLIDEGEFGRSTIGASIRSQLRAGSTPAAPTARNGQLFDTFSAKVIASRHLPDDDALTSRAIVVNMSYSRRHGHRPLTRQWLDLIASELQPKLMGYLLAHFSDVKTSQHFSKKTDSLLSRNRDLAHALAMPLLGKPRLEKEVITALKLQDDVARMERLEQPESLVVEQLFHRCHHTRDYDSGLSLPSKVCVGEFAAGVNDLLTHRGDSRHFNGRKVGHILRSLGIKTKKMGSSGRGFELTPNLERIIHGLALDYGFTRRDLFTVFDFDREEEWGDEPCRLCEEFNLAAGIRFRKRPPLYISRASKRRSIFDSAATTDDSAAPSTSKSTEASKASSVATGKC